MATAPAKRVIAIRMPTIRRSARAGSDMVISEGAGTGHYPRSAIVRGVWPKRI